MDVTGFDAVDAVNIGGAVISGVGVATADRTSAAEVLGSSPILGPTGAAVGVLLDNPQAAADGAGAVLDYIRRGQDPEYNRRRLHLDELLPTPDSPSGDPRDPHHPNVTVPRSGDPNDILGPDGIGAERWISAANPINYTIRFENDPLLANAPAQVVRITQTLDSELDPRSFRLGSFGFSGLVFEVPENRAFFSTRIDLLDRYGIYLDVFAGVNVSDGSIFWEFTSIDPATGEVPVNGFVGFLPPNNTRPEGDGFVSYTVKARRSASTGSRIDALATIVFDQNAPIDTPAIFNTLDASGPDSQVLPLVETQIETRFRVAWSGGDGDVGSGIENFDVYVSENGADYRLWLDDTNLLDAEYLGGVGNTYAFFTVAKDRTGNQEPDPSTSDAITYVFDPFGAPSIPSLSPGSDSGASNSDNRTANPRPVFVGTGVPGYSIAVYANASLIVQGIIDASGNYAVQPTLPLADGIHDITADQINRSGRHSPISAKMSPALVIDTQRPTGAIAPPTPTIRSTSLDQVTFIFSEAVVDFAHSSIRLQLNGGANLLTPQQTLTSNDGGVTWVLGNLSSLINLSGKYTVTLLPQAVRDVAGIFCQKAQHREVRLLST